MENSLRYPFVVTDNTFGNAGFRPYLPLTLQNGERSLVLEGLLDTGAMINVLPYHVGIELGAVWEKQTNTLQLTGNLAQFPARVLLISASVGSFPPIRLAFAWTQSPRVPILLGQVNFFLEFDVCFFRSDLVFEISPKRSKM